MTHLLTENTVAGNFVQVLPFSLLVTLIYLLLRWRDRKRREIPLRAGKETVYALFVLYSIGLLALLVTPINFWSNFWHSVIYGHADWDEWAFFLTGWNFIPSFMKSGVTFGDWVVEMLTMNVLMFVPMGVFMRLTGRKTKIGRPLVVAIGVPLLIELFQPVVGRSFDIDDVILNFLGIVVGYYATSLILLPFGRHSHAPSDKETPEVKNV